MSILGPALNYSSMGVAVVTPCGLGTLWLGVEERISTALGAVGASLGPAYVALMVLLYRRELRYASTLPFAVQGYEAALASDNSDSAVLTVEVRMAIGATPDSELCTKVFGTLAESVVVSGSGVLITSPALPCPYGDSGSYNTKLRLWLRSRSRWTVSW